MTTGALIFAFNNESIDYLQMARWSAGNIRKHLGIPVCVVTDQTANTADFDHVITIDPTHTDSRRTFEDIDQPVTWRNHDRVDAYSLSPWDQTLLLDADYVVASPQLQNVLHATEDLLCHRLAVGIGPAYHSVDSLNSFGSIKMPLYWATVMMFRKTNRSRMTFDIMQMVRDNWRHYCDIYGVSRSHYRNDFALSIALHVLSGHTGRIHCIPWQLITVLPDQRIDLVAEDRYRIEWTDSVGARRWTLLDQTDFHAMGKGHLGAIVADQG